MNTANARSQFSTDLDSELPSVAALAAAEVDDLINNETTELIYLSKLSGIFDKIFLIGDPDRGTSSRLLDPIGTSVMSRSISDSLGSQLQTYEDLVNAADKLADEIRKVGERDQKILASAALLNQLKTFCLSLSKYALASKEKIDKFPGGPKYRR